MAPNNVKHFVWSSRDEYRINEVILDFYMSITSLWLVSCFSKSNNFIGCLISIIFHALSSCHSRIGFRNFVLVSPTRETFKKFIPWGFVYIKSYWLIILFLQTLHGRLSCARFKNATNKRSGTNWLFKIKCQRFWFRFFRNGCVKFVWPKLWFIW